MRQRHFKRAKSDASGMVARAIASESRGRAEDAAALFELALAAAPTHIEALFHLASLRFRQGRLEDALRLFDRAATAHPGEPLAWGNLAIVLRLLARHEEALACCDKALALRPDYPEALNSRGVALLSLSRPAEAAECLARARTLRPDYLEAIVNHGCALREVGQLEKSLAAFDQALEFGPDNAAIFTNRAAILIDLERPAEALASVDRALALAPDHFISLNNRGSALKMLKRPQEALAACDASLAVNPHSAETWSNRAGVLADLNRCEEALADYDRALALKPGDVLSHQNRSIVLGELGRFEEAGQAIRRAISLVPDCARFYYNLTQMERLSREAPEVAGMEALAQKPHDARDEIFLHYALAKVYEDAGNSEAAFARQCSGAALKRGLTRYDEAATLGAMERTQRVFDAGLFAKKLAGRGDASLAPIFIVGMPRSGSTLVEQILASHSGVAGLGEIDAFSKAMAGLGRPFSFPDAVASLTEDDLSRMGENYIRRVRALAPVAGVIVDKLLDNFRFLGLIHLALPNARFIHIRRDPLETCLSCFSKWFSDGLDYSYDLAELGRYYRAYDGLMAHWREVLPGGVMLEAWHEDIVADLDGQSRRLADFCGLVWDPRCLEFHKTERQVRTASKTQVRQPLFNRLGERKTALERHLAPLKAELEAGGARQGTRQGE